MKLKKHELVEVTWLDHAGHSGWQSFDPERHQLAVCKSVGYVVHSNKDELVLASGKDAHDTPDMAPYNHMLIRAWKLITKVKRLK